MGADDNVHSAPLQALDGLLLLGRGAEAAQELDPHRVGGKAFLKGAVVLLGQDGSRHQDGHLLPIHHSLKGGPDGHFRLPVAHIATDDVIHGLRLLHGLLHRPDGLQLVRGLFIGEAGLKLLLPDGVGGKLVPRYRLPGGVELQQSHCQFLDRFLHPALGPAPLGPPQLVEAGGAPLHPHILLQEVNLIRGHIEPVFPRILDQEVVPLYPWTSRVFIPR